MAIIDNPIVSGGGTVDQESALKYMLEHKTNYAGIAAGLANLTTLPTFTQPSRVTNFTSAFSGCSSLTTSGIAGLDISSGTYYDETFRDCTSITSLPIGLDLSTASSTIGTFSGCTNLVGDLSFGAGPVGIKSRSRMFENCKKITSVTFARSAHGMEDMSSMFSGCTDLQSVSIPSVSYTSSTVYLTRNRTMYKCPSLSSVPNIFDDSRIIDFYSTFSGCTSITSVTIDVTGTLSLAYTFQNCSSLTSITMHGDTGRSKDFRNMLSGCSSLVSFPTSKLDLSSGSISNVKDMFKSCPSLDNATLNGILGSMLTLPLSGSTNRNLKYIGLSSTQATTCTGLSNWTALSAAGWTTGY